MMEEITVKFTIIVDSNKRVEEKAKILDFLKELDIVKLEMSEE